MGCHRFRSLRWHYPDQVLAVGEELTLSAWQPKLPLPNGAIVLNRKKQVKQRLAQEKRHSLHAGGPGRVQDDQVGASKRVAGFRRRARVKRGHAVHRDIDVTVPVTKRQVVAGKPGNLGLEDRRGTVRLLPPRNVMTVRHHYLPVALFGRLVFLQGLVPWVMVYHGPGPHGQAQLFEHQMGPRGVVEEVDVTPSVAESNPVIDRSIVENVVVARGHEDGDIHPGKLGQGVVDVGPVDSGVIEQVADDEQCVGGMLNGRVDHCRQALQPLRGVMVVADVNVGGVNEA